MIYLARLTKLVDLSKSQHQQLASELHSGAIRLLRGLRKTDSAFGVGPARLSALSVLIYAGPRTPSDLAEIEQVRSPTMTKILRGLVDQGLVRLEPSPEDRRSKIASATARGKRLLESARQARLARLTRALDEIPASDRATLAKASRILRGLPLSSE